MRRVERLLLEIMSVYNGDAWHGDPLVEMLDGVDELAVDAKPIAGKKSIHELTLHIIAWMEIVTRRCAGDSREPDADESEPDATSTDWKATRTRLQRAHEHLLDQVARLSEEDLDRQVPGRRYSFEFMISGLVHHTAYHEGQIAMLKSLRAR